MADDTIPAHTKDKVQKWLLEDGWKLKEGEPIPDSLWTFLAEDEMGRKIVIGQRPNRQDEIMIQASVTIGDDTNKLLVALDEDKRSAFLWKLRFELIQTNLEFQGVEAPIKRVSVVQRIFLDALGKDLFMRRTSEVRKGILIVMWMLAREFGEQPAPRQMGFQR